MMSDRILDANLKRSANEQWYVASRASQKDRYRRCLDLLSRHFPLLELVYDVGAGTGHFAGLLSDKAQRVIAVERDLRRVSICKERNASKPNVDVLLGDFLKLPLESGSATCLCALEMLYYFEEGARRQFVEKIADVLRPQGGLLISTNIFQAPSHAEERLAALLEPHFEMLEIQRIHRIAYYKLELPLIRLLDELNYLRHVKIFYPHVTKAGHVVYSPFWDNVLLPSRFILDRILAPAMRSIALTLLRSRLLFATVTRLSERLAPERTRSQVIVMARKRT
ncbi:class I SAM-dependent methyltransferase [Desulfobulbus alkaliphilus]|uniref:class I SAM-dependent methyltransferase n=1 Tax=Desulfobulbus alkaliphilus TaxID=869814 RepID=UPI00196695F3|nr:class I SAM-dependent methyltransferase [Desulfobulbus alkaliphilus]MBM9535994.1 class I SAM-dependent methyltransferase [Desulfobulbus alkaliphilus]